MAKIFHAIDTPMPPQQSWEERWEGSDRGLICSWARGVEKARETPLLREQSLRGELPPLVWKGGADTAVNSGKRAGSLHYLATWQGLRGEPLNVDTEAEVKLTCTLHKTVVTFTGDLRALALVANEEG